MLLLPLRQLCGLALVRHRCGRLPLRHMCGDLLPLGLARFGFRGNEVRVLARALFAVLVLIVFPRFAAAVALVPAAATVVVAVVAKAIAPPGRFVASASVSADALAAAHATHIDLHDALLVAVIVGFGHFAKALYVLVGLGVVVARRFVLATRDRGRGRCGGGCRRGGGCRFPLLLVRGGGRCSRGGRSARPPLLAGVRVGLTTRTRVRLFALALSFAYQIFALAPVLAPRAFAFEGEESGEWSEE